MCEIVKSETLCGPWATPNVIVNQCPNFGKWWVRRASMNQIVCSIHLPGTIERFKAVDHETAHDLYHLGPRDEVIVSMSTENPKNGYRYWG